MAGFERGNKMKQLILFLDSGDTFADESSEILDENRVVTHSDLFSGAKEQLLRWHAEGYRLIMVADGKVASFENIYREHGIGHCFEHRIISEAVGKCKPAAEMFSRAMEVCGLTEADKSRIVMIGNNLERDVVGANRAGICPVFFCLSKRRRTIPQTAEEQPAFVAESYEQLDALIRVLETQIANRRAIGLPGLPAGQSVSV